jgi:hypothetical protein
VRRSISPILVAMFTRPDDRKLTSIIAALGTMTSPFDCSRPADFLVVAFEALHRRFQLCCTLSGVSERPQTNRPCRRCVDVCANPQSKLENAFGVKPSFELAALFSDLLPAKLIVDSQYPSHGDV